MADVSFSKTDVGELRTARRRHTPGTLLIVMRGGDEAHRTRSKQMTSVDVLRAGD